MIFLDAYAVLALALLAAPGEGDSVATSDAAVATVARAEGIGVVALPDTSGRRP